MKKGFTLAEILIVISVIGVLSAILMPMAFNSSPDENVLKFKKSHATFGTMIREMVGSDKYFYEGDLGLDYKQTQDYTKTYVCKVMADILTVKKEACSSAQQNSYYAVQTYSSGDITATAKANLDSHCKSAYAGVGPEIETTDGVVWYQGSPYHTFGVGGTNRYFSAPDDTSPRYPDEDNFDANYKTFCIDVDGTGPEAPFGYGVRADGKILMGKRAEEWNKKSVQRGDE